MNILIVYDSKKSVSKTGYLPEDFGAEYDDESVVCRIVEALKAGGHPAGRLCLAEDFVERILSIQPDIVFNIAEGVRGRGRESLVPAWLDHIGVTYTGSDAVALGISLDKALSKRIAISLGVNTPPFMVIETLEDLENDISLEYPIFVKPVAEGSSMGIREGSLVETEIELKERVGWVLSRYRDGCLIEEFAPGREFCVGILGNRSRKVLPTVEVKTAGGFYSYEHKSIHKKELICPASTADAMEQEMADMAQKVYSALGCRDLARVDFKLDRESKPAFLEINPLPGLADEYSIFPEQARAAGMSYTNLINHILDLAVERWEEKT